jgi:hypothetical protein
MMMRWGFAAFATGAFVVAACSSFSSADSGDVGSGDSGSDVANDGSPSDAGAEAFVPETPCPPGSFCDGFERDSMVADGWDFSRLESTTAHLSLDKANVFSGLGALRLDIDQGSTTPTFLQKTVKTATTTTISFSIFYDVAPTADVVVGAMNLGGAVVYVAVFPQGAIGFADQVFPTDAGAALTSSTTLFPIGVGRWRRVTLGYVSGAAPTLIAKVDGMDMTRPTEHATGTPKYVQLGAASNKAGTASIFHFDEVVVTAE